MFKLLLRALFKPPYRRTAKRHSKPASETLAFKAGHKLATRPKNAPKITSSDSGVFDAETAQPTTRPRVIEGPAYVTDGDTITIQGTQVRLYEIDAPELDHPYGKKAKWAMVRLCRGHRIRAEVAEEDTYGRTVAKCFLPDGSDLSAEMVKLGLAIDWPKFSGGQYSHLEITGVRKKLWLADARQKCRMHVWETYASNSKPPE